MKTFFDSIFISSNEHEGEEYPIKLEYFKTIEDDENVEAKYGVEVVLTEFINGKVNVESKRVENICNDETQINEILIILRNNKVTPIGIEDAIDEIFVKL